jgi:hypothetical protein
MRRSQPTHKMDVRIPRAHRAPDLLSSVHNRKAQQLVESSTNSSSGISEHINPRPCGESLAKWGEFVSQCRDPKGDFHPDVKHLPHHAARILGTPRKSRATVGMKTEHWYHQRKVDALKRGPHQSASFHRDFLCMEFMDMIHKGNG